MKKCNAVWLAVLMMLIAALPSAALGEGIILPGKGWMEAYDEMTAAVELGRYEDARKLIREYQLVELNVKNSREYDLYLRGLACMDQGAYGEAGNIFYGLACIDEDENTAGFRNSEILYYYCAGRSVEAVGDYAAAVQFYNLCLSYGDAVTRMTQCMSMQNNARQTQAEEKFRQAQLLQDAALMEEAQALYAALGNAQMASFCRQEAARIRNLQVYNDAVAQYEKARLSGNVQDLRAAGSALAALGDYENSKEMVQEIQGLIAQMQRHLTLECAGTSAEVISLRWNDTEAAEKYIVAWKPAGAVQEEKRIIQGNRTELTGLLPGTEYVISVAAHGAAQPAAVLNASTKRAESYQAPGFYVSRSALIGLKRVYLSISSLEDLLENSPQVLEYPADNQIVLANTLPAAQDKVFCYSFTYRQNEVRNEAVKARWVLRTKTAGVYATEYSIFEGLPASGRLYCELEELLNQLYQAHSAWPQESCAVELYLDGCLAATGLLDFSK